MRVLAGDTGKSQCCEGQDLDEIYYTLVLAQLPLLP